MPKRKQGSHNDKGCRKIARDTDSRSDNTITIAEAPSTPDNPIIISDSEEEEETSSSNLLVRKLIEISGGGWPAYACANLLDKHDYDINAAANDLLSSPVPPPTPMNNPHKLGIKRSLVQDGRVDTLEPQQRRKKIASARSSSSLTNDVSRIKEVQTAASNFASTFDSCLHGNTRADNISPEKSQADDPSTFNDKGDIHFPPMHPNSYAKISSGSVNIEILPCACKLPENWLVDLNSVPHEKEARKLWAMICEKVNSFDHLRAIVNSEDVDTVADMISRDIFPMSPEHYKKAYSKKWKGPKSGNIRKKYTTFTVNMMELKLELAKRVRAFKVYVGSVDFVKKELLKINELVQNFKYNIIEHDALDGLDARKFPNSTGRYGSMSLQQRDVLNRWNILIKRCRIIEKERYMPFTKTITMRYCDRPYSTLPECPKTCFKLLEASKYLSELKAGVPEKMLQYKRRFGVSRSELTLDDMVNIMWGDYIHHIYPGDPIFQVVGHLDPAKKKHYEENWKKYRNQAMLKMGYQKKNYAFKFVQSLFEELLPGIKGSTTGNKDEFYPNGPYFNRIAIVESKKSSDEIILYFEVILVNQNKLDYGSLMPFYNLKNFSSRLIDSAALGFVNAEKSIPELCHDLNEFNEVAGNSYYVPSKYSRPTKNFSDYLDNFLAEERELAPQPEGLMVKLRPYQLQSLSWMLEQERNENGTVSKFFTSLSGILKLDKPLSFCMSTGVLSPVTASSTTCGGFLCDEMGLGKTICCLGLILSNPASPQRSAWSTTDNDCCNATLVVVKLSLVGQWINEAQARLKDTKKMYAYHGQNRNRDPAFLAAHDIVVTTYETIAKDEFYWARKSKIVNPDPCHAIKWYRIILDESHSIKDPCTMLSRSVLRLRSNLKWCVTGTPINTSTIDLKTQSYFIGIPPQSIDFTCGTMVELLLKKCMIRHTKAQKFNGVPIVTLPERVDVDVEIEFTRSEREVYQGLKEQAKAVYESFKRSNTIGTGHLKLMSMLLPMRRASAGGKHMVQILDEWDEKALEELRNTIPGEESVVLPVERNGECCVSSLVGGNPDGVAPCPLCRKSIKYKDLKSVSFAAPNEVGSSKTKSKFKPKEAPPSIPRNFAFTSKLEKLVKILSDIRVNNPKSKSLVFTQFSTTLQWLSQELPKKGFQFVGFNAPKTRSFCSKAHS
eukprot:UC4_evm2s385